MPSRTSWGRLQCLSSEFSCLRCCRCYCCCCWRLRRSKSCWRRRVMRGWVLRWRMRWAVASLWIGLRGAAARDSLRWLSVALCARANECRVVGFLTLVNWKRKNLKEAGTGEAWVLMSQIIVFDCVNVDCSSCCGCPGCWFVLWTCTWVWLDLDWRWFWRG